MQHVAMVILVELSLVAAIVVDAYLFPTRNLPILYAVPVLIASLRLSPRAVGVTAGLALVLDLLCAYLKNDLLWVWPVALLIIGSLAVLFSQQRQEAARRAREAEAAQRRVEALCEATKQVGESLKLEPVLKTVLEAARRLFAADRAAIYRQDESGRYVCPASFGLSTIYVETVCRHFAISPVGAPAIATRQPAAIADVPAVTRGTPLGEVVAAEGVRAVLVLPLLRDDELVGTLGIYHDQPRRYTDEEIQLARALASQAAIAIDNARLHQAAQARAREVETLLEATRRAEEKLARRNRELLTLHRISEITLNAPSLPAAFQEIVEEIGTATGFPAVAIELYDEARQMMVFRGVKGVPLPPHEGPFEVPVPETLSGIVARTGRPLVETHALARPEYANPTLRRLGVQTFVCVPMVVSGRVIGALSLAHPEAIALDDRLVDWTASLANYVASLIERYQAEDALRASEERFRNIFNHSNDAIFVIDPERDRIVDVNSRACSLLGYSREELLSTSVSAIHPNEMARLLAFTQSVAERGHGWTNELTCSTKAGQAVPCEISASLIDIGGRSHVLALVRDVTERKRAEEALRFLAEASALLVASLDYEPTFANVARLAVPFLADWCIVDVVEEDGSIHRLAVAQADPAKADLASALQRRYPLDPKSENPVAKVLRSGRPELYGEVSEAQLIAAARDAEHLRLLRKIGPVSAMIVPLVARAGLLGAITFVSAESGRRYGSADLTLAEELARRAALAVDNARLYRDAQEAIRARNEILSSVSHDLKNPLAVIKGYAQRLRQLVSRASPPPMDKQLEGLARIDATATRMTALIDELLDVARLQAGQPLDLDRRPVDLVALARQVADEHQKTAERYHIQVEATPPELTGVWDPARLERVLANLLSNAIKYSPDGGNIRVAVTRQRDVAGDWAVLEVRDEGLGIPAEDLPHIFNRFHRAGNVAGRIQGTGIGLASAFQIVKQHGGAITAASEEGAGSTFAVRLPLATAESSHHTTAVSYPAGLQPQWPEPLGE